MLTHWPEGQQQQTSRHARARTRPSVMLCCRGIVRKRFALLTLRPAPYWLEFHRALLSAADSPLPGSEPESESSPSSSSSSPSSLSSASLSSVFSRFAALPYSPSSRWPAASTVDMLAAAVEPVWRAGPCLELKLQANTSMSTGIR